MGSTLSETALEGATTVSEATQSEVKYRQKRFISLLPLLTILLIKRFQRESEETQLEVQKSILASLIPLPYPFLPQPVNVMALLKESAEKERMVSGIAKRDQPSESEMVTGGVLTSQSQNVRQKRAGDFPSFQPMWAANAGSECGHWLGPMNWHSCCCCCSTTRDKLAM